MRKDIRVSFSDTPEQDQLYDEIIAEGKRTFLGQSGYMKLAAREKLERDHGSSNKVQKTSVNINQGGFMNGINSMDDLMPQ